MPRACVRRTPGRISVRVNPRPVEAVQDPRARQLLRTLIARYIRDGVPVGSQTLARHAGLDVSPATIRNILSDLEEVGLLTSPHTSQIQCNTSSRKMSPRLTIALSIPSATASPSSIWPWASSASTSRSSSFSRLLWSCGTT